MIFTHFVMWLPIIIRGGQFDNFFFRGGSWETMQKGPGKLEGEEHQGSGYSNFSGSRCPFSFPKAVEKSCLSKGVDEKQDHLGAKSEIRGGVMDLRVLVSCGESNKC